MGIAYQYFKSTSNSKRILLLWKDGSVGKVTQKKDGRRQLCRQKWALVKKILDIVLKICVYLICNIFNIKTLVVKGISNWR